MTLPLTTETLAAAYDYLRTTPPFNRWNLPESEDVVFAPGRCRRTQGWYKRKGRKHIIIVSSNSIGHSISLIQVVAHEMVHLFQALSGTETSAEHNAAFWKLAAQVCKRHGFDPKSF